MPVTEKDLDELLTVDQAADLMHLHRATLYRMIQTRDLDVVRVGRGQRIRITRRSILDYVNRNVTRADVPTRRPRAS